MADSSEIQTGQGITLRLLHQFHLVMCTKYRCKVLQGDIEERLKYWVREVFAHFGLELIQQESDQDHLHIVFGMSPVFGPLSKYRIYPTSGQVTALENTFSMCRHLWNWSLAERRDTYEQTGEGVSYWTQQNRLPELKDKRPWFKGIHSQVLQDVLRRLDKGFDNFFRRVKEGAEEPGYPKFKKRG